MGNGRVDMKRQCTLWFSFYAYRVWKSL